MDKSNQRPIIIKRIKKIQGGHHGGAWKVAYADFMTAMMAFFLLLWILSDEQEAKTGLADYFTPAEIPLANIGANGVLAGEALDGKDLFASRDGVAGEPKSETGRELADAEDEKNAQSPADMNAAQNPWAVLASDEPSIANLANKDVFGTLEQTVAELAEEFSSFGENVRIHEDDGGIAIEIIDIGERPLFAPGSYEVTAANMLILNEIVEKLADIPGNIRITGHTDATPYRGSGFYGNWELSADRANATRRALIGLGIPIDRILEVSGAAAMDPINSSDPAAAENRRVTVRVMSQDE